LNYTNGEHAETRGRGKSAAWVAFMSEKKDGEKEKRKGGVEFRQHLAAARSL